MNALYEIQEELTHRLVELGNAYPASGKFPRAIRSAGEALSRARSDGDNQLSSERQVQWGTDTPTLASRHKRSLLPRRPPGARTDHRQLVLAETLSVSQADRLAGTWLRQMRNVQRNTQPCS
jgi:hypothetical protein